MIRTLCVVVTFNRFKLLQECMEALFAQQRARFDILVIDNNSTDGTREYLAQLKDSRVSVIRTDKNIGGAGGFHLGIKYACEKEYTYVWVMDDDTIPTKNAFYALITAAQKIGNFGFLSSKSLWIDGTPCKINIQKTDIVRCIRLLPKADVPQKIAIASFVSLFIPTAAVYSVGLPYKEFFIWGDDTEYTMRISSNYDCFLIPDSVVVHKTKTNNKVGIESESQDRLWRYAFLYRNEFFLYKNLGVFGLCYYLSRVAFHIFKILIRSDCKFKKIRIVIASVISGIRFSPKVHYPN